MVSVALPGEDQRRRRPEPQGDGRLQGEVLITAEAERPKEKMDSGRQQGGGIAKLPSGWSVKATLGEAPHPAAPTDRSAVQAKVGVAHQRE